MSKHKQPGGIWTAQSAHCAVLITQTSKPCDSLNLRLHSDKLR